MNKETRRLEERYYAKKRYKSDCCKGRIKVDETGRRVCAICKNYCLFWDKKGA